MSDLYTELLVKKKRTAKDSLIKYGMIGTYRRSDSSRTFFSPFNFNRGSQYGNRLLFHSSENGSGV